MKAWCKQLIDNLGRALGMLDAPRLQPVPVRDDGPRQGKARPAR
ncbi:MULTISPECIES: PA1414 family protein [Pseudomonas]|jgi:hypothetical protein|nr:PA1414 family protein [Serpens gallinarum]